ncbi:MULTISPECIES: VOC family protein [unclassified Ruegeria]|uniref:VOC family protein n=1 Tax=unclassified Ruegeria TaxID=2625375 RepID=UPI00149301F0|nr:MULTISPECIES: VOC family protein [unclassified Ruegeria]NOD33018.1 VOC family protein [Ruegeria sp. HKCCD7296]NOE42732.1 VOC family protein [Ruegeria sp. HKCCD7319]
MRLSALRLRVADPLNLAAFYRDILGMFVREEGANVRVGYAGEDADLLLLPGGGGYTHDRGQRYWKIGITVPDVDLAATHLRARDVPVSDPNQFLDIGYMCHLTDPEGFVIELLQQDFEGNRPPYAADPDAPFAQARIGQITLRTGDIAAEDTFWRGQGMSLLSMQEVAPYGFDLHFYAFTQETPPNPDLWSVENREWLWKRPYTTLEFQHVAGAQFAPVPDYQGIEIEGVPEPLNDAFGDPILPG